MKKFTAEINFSYTYDANRSRAHYSLDGLHWKNGGEFAEIATKSVLGFKPEKDASTPYNVASDIEELNASVKSSNFTLVNFKLADSFEESITVYFKNVHSSLWIYTVIINDVVTLYYMSKEEFNRFLHTFCFFNERGCVRCNKTTAKMVAWLENEVA